LGLTIALGTDQIAGIKERISTGRKKYFLELKNGKIRDLIEIQLETEFKEIETLVTKNKK
jgi:hypothetical protein